MSGANDSFIVTWTFSDFRLRETKETKRMAGNSAEKEELDE